MEGDDRTESNLNPSVRKGQVGRPNFVGYEHENEASRTGGQGQVFYVRAEETGLPCVVKVFKSSTPDSVKSVQDSVKVLCALKQQHPHHFVTIHESGVLEDGRPYVVMDRIHGVHFDDHLKTVLKDGHLSNANFMKLLRLIWRIAWLVVRINDGLAIHKDLKPSNILITTDPHDPDREVPYVIDLDLARIATSPTPTGFVGSRAWSAPEQFEAPDKISAQTDVYVLGRLLYFALSGGRFPFKSLDPGEMFAEPPIHPEARRLQPLLKDELEAQLPRSPVPHKLWELTRMALQRNPADRLESPRAFASELHSFIATGEAETPSVTGVINELRRILKSIKPAYSEGHLKLLDRWEERAKQTGIDDLRALTEKRRSNRNLLFWAIDVGTVAWQQHPDEVGPYRRVSLEMVRYLLDTAPSLVSCPDEYGWQPIHLAANRGLVKIVELLLNRGADPDNRAQIHKPDGRWAKGGGASTVYEAAFCPHEAEGQEIIRLLMSASKNPDVLLNTPSNDQFTPLMAAIWRNNWSTAEFLIKDYEADKSRWKERRTSTAYVLAVHSYCRAIQARDETMLSWVKSEYDEIPSDLPRGSQPGLILAINELLMTGDIFRALEQITSAINANQQNALHRSLPPFDRTLLHQAAERGYTDVVRHLCEKARFNPIVHNNHGRTPRDLVPRDCSSTDEYLRERELAFRLKPT